MTPDWMSFLKPPAVDSARGEPARLFKDSGNFWEDIRKVLLDSDPIPRNLEIVRRWLRDDVERETFARLSEIHSAGLVRMACWSAPRLLWTLPYSKGDPPERYHRRIVAILLPQKLRRLESELAVFAFHEGLPKGRG